MIELIFGLDCSSCKCEGDVLRLKTPGLSHYLFVVKPHCVILHYPLQKCSNFFVALDANVNVSSGYMDHCSLVSLFWVTLSNNYFQFKVMVLPSRITGITENCINTCYLNGPAVKGHYFFIPYP